jgi:hypothetical protein
LGTKIRRIDWAVVKFWPWPNDALPLKATPDPLDFSWASRLFGHWIRPKIFPLTLLQERGALASWNPPRFGGSPMIYHVWCVYTMEL